MNERNDHLDWDDELSALYRKIPQPAPPAALDERLLQAAHQAVQQPSRHSSRRWAVPVAMAAVLVLGIGLVRIMEREMPRSPEPSVLQSPQFENQSGLRSGTAEPKADIATPRPAADMPQLQLQRSFEDRDNAVDLLEQERSAPASVTVPAARQLNEEIRAQAEAEKRSNGRQKSTRLPHEWLREIAELRQQGRDTEADALLKEFRRHYPDYLLPATSEQPKQP